MYWARLSHRGWGINLGEGVLLLFIALTLFIMGIVTGAFAVTHVELGQRRDLFMLFDSFLQGIGQEPGRLRSSSVLLESLSNNLKTVGALWLLGLTVVGIPVVALITFLRGFLIGFTVGFLALEMGWKGLVLSLAGVFPHNLLAVPAMLVLAVASVSFSLYLVRRRSRDVPLMAEFLRYSTIALGALVMMSVSAGIEAYVVPPLMAWVSRLLS